MIITIFKITLNMLLYNIFIHFDLKHGEYFQLKIFHIKIWYNNFNLTEFFVLNFTLYFNIYIFRWDVQFPGPTNISWYQTFSISFLIYLPSIHRISKTSPLPQPIPRHRTNLPGSRTEPTRCTRSLISFLIKSESYDYL